MQDEEARIHHIQNCAKGGLETLKGIVLLGGIDKIAYMHKVRIKDVESIKNKLIDRRRKKPEYQINDIKDLIGLRFLTLFKDDLPNLVSKTLSVVADNLQSIRPNNQMFFSGNELVQCIEEAIIYYPNRETDISYNLVVDQFKNAGFRIDEPTGESEPPLPKKGVVQIQRKVIEYSSIHLILRVSGKFAAIPPEFADKGGIPIECQIRTAIEDIWAEIDHKTIYKGFSDQGVSLEHDNGEKHAKTTFASAARQLSTNLKRHLDACSDTADNIKYFVRTISKSQGPNVNQQLKSYSPQKILFAAKRAQKETQFTKFAELLDRVYTKKEKSIEILDSCIDEANRLRNEHGLRIGDSGSSDAFRRLRHRLNMELALLYINRGESRKRHAGRDVIIGVEESENDFRRAYVIYNALSRDERDESDPMIYYRLGTLQHYLLGDHAPAISYFDEAYKKLKDRERASEPGVISDDKLMRINLMYRLACEYYLAADESRNRSACAENPVPINEKQAALYLKAAKISFDAEKIIDHCIKSKPGPDNLRKLNEERAQIVNSALDSIIQFLRSSGITNFHASAVEEKFRTQDISREQVEKAVKILEEHSEGQPHRLDTLRNYYDFMDDCSNLKKICMQLKQILLENEQLWRERYKPQPWFFDEMLRDAEAGLKKCP
ncbi:MAG: RelA/SpoT domain-containing protein [Pseudomonadota bacterium]|nr:RelA/SpoT domain-containing protein [Pseudomonadota bacterium]